MIGGSSMFKRLFFLAHFDDYFKNIVNHDCFGGKSGHVGIVPCQFASDNVTAIIFFKNGKKLKV